MKYACEICGQQFDRETACIEHEKKCKELHGPGLETAAALNRVLEAAEAAHVTVATNSSEVRYFVKRAVYDTIKQTVVLITNH